MMQREMSMKLNNDESKQSQPTTLQHPDFSHVLKQDERRLIPTTSCYPFFNISPLSAFLRVPPHPAPLSARDLEVASKNHHQTNLSQLPSPSSPVHMSPKPFSIAHLTDEPCQALSEDCSIQDSLGRFSPSKFPSSLKRKPLSSVNKNFNTFETHTESNAFQPASLLHDSCIKKSPSASRFDSAEKGTKNGVSFSGVPNYTASLQQHLKLLSLMFPKVSSGKPEQAFIEQLNHLNKNRVDQLKSFYPISNPYCCNFESWDSPCPSRIQFPEMKSISTPPTGFVASDVYQFEENLAKWHLSNLQNFPQDLSLIQSKKIINSRHELLLNMEQQESKLFECYSRKNLAPDFLISGKSSRIKDFSSRNFHNVAKKRKLSSSDSASSVCDDVFFQSRRSSLEMNSPIEELQERKSQIECNLFHNDGHVQEREKNSPSPTYKITPDCYFHSLEAAERNDDTPSPSRNETECFKSCAYPSLHRAEMYRYNQRENSQGRPKLNSFSVQSIIGKAKAY